VLATPENPLARVFELESRTLRQGLVIGTIGALVLHGIAAGEAARLAGGISGWAFGVRSDVQAYLARFYDVELVNPPPPPRPPDPPPEPTAPAPTAPKPVANEAPRPAPAQAGKILTQEPNPDEPVDLTGQGFVTGSAETYAGGVTSSAGTSSTAVHNLSAAPGGVPGGTGTSPRPVSRQDLSRSASIQGSTEWNCPFPPEADVEQIDSQRVQVVITVRPDGGAQEVKVVNDPGHGFGRAARQCALRQRYNPARDQEGRPLLTTMAPLIIRFTR
jgi:protein TonB